MTASLILLSGMLVLGGLVAVVAALVPSPLRLQPASIASVATWLARPKTWCG